MKTSYVGPRRARHLSVVSHAQTTQTADPQHKPKFPRQPGHKSLAERAIESGDPGALCLYTNMHSRVPYRVQIAYLWIKHILFKRPLS